MMLKSILGTVALALASVATAQNTYPPSQPAPMEAPVAPAPSTEAAPMAESAPAAMAAPSATPPRCSATVRDSCIQDERYASRKSTPGMRDNNALHNGGRKAMRRR